MKKALTHIHLGYSNDCKLEALDSVAVEYLRVCQLFIDWLISENQMEPNKFASLPDVETRLSKRWQRCCWQQACGIVQSWFSNKRRDPPRLKQISIQANANVVHLQKSGTKKFDYWLRVSTLEKGKPVYLPLRLHKYAKKEIERWTRLATGIRLNKQGKRWFATLTLEKNNSKPELEKYEVVGIDIGLVSTVSTSNGKQFGEYHSKLKKKLACQTESRKRKQKLNACLRKKGLDEVALNKGKAERFARNEINRALNNLVKELKVKPNVVVAKERLNVGLMRFKSKEANRILRAGQIGFIEERLEYKLDLAVIGYKSVQSAYSSQECSRCGFVCKENRKTQSQFKCLFCGFEEWADVNAASNIAKRFGDVELNSVDDYREVLPLLEGRFLLTNAASDARAIASG